MRVLARLKFLHGKTRLDVFDSSADRRLIAAYEAVIAEILAMLDGARLAAAAALAALPEKIAGYGHVRDKAVRVAGQERDRLLAAYRASGMVQAA